MDDDLVRAAYQAYSAQDLERLPSSVSEDVDWPDGEQRIQGKALLRSCWVRQWTRTRTEDVPVRIVGLSPTTCVVQIDQVVRASSGEDVSSGEFVHVFQLDGALIARLDIVPLLAPGSRHDPVELGHVLAGQRKRSTGDVLAEVRDR